MINIINPHGGQLINLLVERPKIPTLPSWSMTPRQLCDFELIVNGGFSPLRGFLSQNDYESVINNLCLSNGIVWPMPIVLDVSRQFSECLTCGDEIILSDGEGTPLGLMKINSLWEADKQREAQLVFKTKDNMHPGVNYLFNYSNPVYLGGEIQAFDLPKHYDFKELRMSPKILRERFMAMEWQNIVAFQTRNPMHRAHQELTVRAIQEYNLKLLIHPVVGVTKPGDIDYFTRVRCYKHIAKQYPSDSMFLSLLPLAMRMAGPREALWHAIIRKNYGCSHFIVGRDHAGPGKNSSGQDFYGPYDAQECVQEFSDKIGVTMVPFKEMVYVKNKKHYLPVDELKSTDIPSHISGTEFRRLLKEGLDIPEWFSYPEIIRELRQIYPPKSKEGFTVFLTGLSGSGKSTIANALMMILKEITDRKVTLLDGDIVRKHLASELGFSREHRDLNVSRIGFVASEITKNGGVAICAQIAPYEMARVKVREMIEEVGGFFEVYMATPLAVCEKRDRKGLYQKARAGLIQSFTGIDDPYEVPSRPELILDTTSEPIDSSLKKVLIELVKAGYISRTDTLTIEAQEPAVLFID